jgi:hypothetical protein
VEDRGERPGDVASERTGLLEQTTQDGSKHNETWGSTTPHPTDSSGAYPVRTGPDTQVLNFVFKCRFRHNLTVGCMYELIKSNQIKSVPSTIPSLPSKVGSDPFSGRSTRAWNAFPDCLGHGAQSWRGFGGMLRGGVSQDA